MAAIKREINYDERANGADVRGPTHERLSQSQGGSSIGGEDRGVRIYHMLDTPLDRLYSRLVKVGKQIDRLRAEYAALREYSRIFIESGMIGSVGAVDPNRTYSPNPSGRSFLSKTDKQLADRDKLHFARRVTLTHQQGIVVDNVVCNEHSLEIAGYSIGKESKTRAIAGAEAILREAGFSLARSWKMV
jgi:hypothetical protein